jgi:WD40 repeat protein
MLAAVPAGETREVGRCRGIGSTTIAWQPGTPLIFAVGHDGLKGDDIFRLDLDTGVRENVVGPKALRDTITSLRCSPDGKWLAYLLGGRQIMLRSLATGEEKSLGEVSQQGSWNTSLAWSEDSGTVLTGVSATAGGSEIVAHPLDGGEPYSLYTTAAKIGISPWAVAG